MEQRTAYFILETQRDMDGLLIALIAKEGEQGYYRTNWRWGMIYSEANLIADQMNQNKGISRHEAFKIIASTMKGSWK